MALEGEQLGFLEKTLKLIEKYGLFDDYSYDEKGLIKIDKDALDEALFIAINF